MRVLSLILVFAIAASAMGAGEVLAAHPEKQHACCKSKESQQKKDNDDCRGACRMTCCRTITAPLDPAVTPLDLVGLTARVTLPPLLVNDLGEPQSIFHPPRA